VRSSDLPCPFPFTVHVVILLFYFIILIKTLNTSLHWQHACAAVHDVSLRLRSRRARRVLRSGPLQDTQMTFQCPFKDTFIPRSIGSSSFKVYSIGESRGIKFGTHSFLPLLNYRSINYEQLSRLCSSVPFSTPEITTIDSSKHSNKHVHARTWWCIYSLVSQIPRSPTPLLYTFFSLSCVAMRFAGT